MKYLKHFANAQEAATILATWPFNTVSSIQGQPGASINIGVAPTPTGNDHYICTFETEYEDEDVLVCQGLSDNISIAPDRLIIDGVEQSEIYDHVTIHNIGTHTIEYYVDDTTVMPAACFSQSNGDAPYFTSIILPDYLTEILYAACSGQSRLTSIICHAVNPPVLEASFEGDYGEFADTNDCPIYVPASSVDAYKAATGWSEYASRIQAIQ